MHKITLTEAGLVLANDNTTRGASNDLEMYPDERQMPGRDGIWTAADDLLVLLLNFTVYASSLSFDDQLAAIVTAAGPMHTRHTLYQAFSIICDLQLVDHELLAHDHVKMLSEFFDALANPDRLVMVFAMMYRIQSMSDLKVLIDKEASSVYHHLRKLSDSGLVFSLGHGAGYVVNTSVMATCLQALIVSLRKEDNDEDNS